MFFVNTIKLIKISAPICINGLINIIASFVSMIFVAKLGQEYLAAGAIGVSTYMTFMTLVLTPFYAIGILISHSRGAKEPVSEVGKIVKNGFWLALFLILPTLAILFNGDKILLFFGQKPSLVAITHIYFYFAALSMVPSLFNAVMGQFFISSGRPQLALLISLMSTPLIIILANFFIFGKYHFPKLGLGGITCATFIVASIFCIAQLCYLFFSKKIRKYQIFSSSIFPNIILCKKIFFLGLPIGVQFGGELAAMAVATYLMGFLGAVALSAAQISSQFSIVIVMISLGISQAVSILVSAAHSENNVTLIKSYLKSSIVTLLLFFVIVFLSLLFFGRDFLRLYVDVNSRANKNLLALATFFIYISIVTLFIDGIRNIYSAALRGFKDSKTPMKIGVICLWCVSLPLCYFTGFILKGGPIGLRMGFLSGFVIASVVLIFVFKNKCASLSRINTLS